MVAAREIRASGEKDDSGCLQGGKQEVEVDEVEIKKPSRESRPQH